MWTNQQELIILKHLYTNARIKLEMKDYTKLNINLKSFI